MPPNRVGRRIPPIQTFFWITLEPKTLQLPINSFMQAIQNLQPESMNGLLHFVGPRKYGGRDRVRTCDPLLAKQVLSQLSYTPTVKDIPILKHFLSIRNPFLRLMVNWGEPVF